MNVSDCESLCGAIDVGLLPTSSLKGIVTKRQKSQLQVKQDA